MKPVSFVTPSSGGTLAVTLPMTQLDAEDTVVPGFMYAQVLAPGEPAAATEFYRVLVLDSLEMQRELNALQLGAERCAGLGHDDGDDPRPAVAVFVNPAVGVVQVANPVLTHSLKGAWSNP
jgi:hypothetical protein